MSSDHHKEREIHIGDYILKETIGKGTFGKVKLGVYLPKNEIVAIKILEKKNIQEKEDYDRTQREMEMIKEFNHPNVILVTEIFANKTCYYIVMEYCEGGELFNYIVKKRRLSEEESSFFFYQIIQGLEYIHSLGIVHRDLKPENLLLSKDHILKIIDFGLSNYFNKKLLSTPCGSPCYASPEMVSSKKYNGYKIDIWASGIVLYAMLCGYLPFEDKDNEVLFKKILRCQLEFPYHLSELSKDMIKKILVTDPDKRITIPEIKRHTFYLKGRAFYKKVFNTFPEELVLSSEDLSYNINKTEGNESKSKQKNKNIFYKSNFKEKDDVVGEETKEIKNKTKMNEKNEMMCMNDKIKKGKISKTQGNIHSESEQIDYSISSQLEKKNYSQDHSKQNELHSQSQSHSKSESINQHSRIKSQTTKIINSMRIPLSKVTNFHSRQTSKLTSNYLLRSNKLKKDIKTDSITIKNTVINVNMIDPNVFVGKNYSKKSQSKPKLTTSKDTTPKYKSSRKNPELKIFDSLSKEGTYLTSPYLETMVNTQENQGSKKENKQYKRITLQVDSPINKNRRMREFTLPEKNQRHLKINSMKTSDYSKSPKASDNFNSKQKNVYSPLNTFNGFNGGYQIKKKQTIENTFNKGISANFIKNTVKGNKQKYPTLFLKKFLETIKK